MTNNTNPQAITYREHSIGMLSSGGDVGGDTQVTDAPSRRFLADLPDGTFAVIDVYAYGTADWDAESEGVPQANDVCVQTFYTVCADLEDVGGSESYGDITYEHPYAIGPKDSATALEWATNYVRSLTPAEFDWDGSPIEH